MALNSNGNGAVGVGQIAGFLASSAVFTGTFMAFAAMIVTRTDVRTSS